MARLQWNDTGNRWYDSGLSHGVLYVEDSYGVPWSGLISVNESPSGGEADSVYVDGVKVNSVSLTEEYAGTIEAYFSPKEFDVCDGAVAVRPGVMVREQNRVPFNLSYKTSKGNDLGPNKKHFLHFIYNAIVTPTERNYSSIEDLPEPLTLSWEFTTKPIEIPRANRSSHLKIDLSMLDSDATELLETIIYGSDELPARIVYPEEIFSIIPSLIVVTDHGDGRYTVSGPDENVKDVGNGEFLVTAPEVLKHSSGYYILGD